MKKISFKLYASYVVVLTFFTLLTTQLTVCRGLAIEAHFFYNYLIGTFGCWSLWVVKSFIIGSLLLIVRYFDKLNKTENEIWKKLLNLSYWTIYYGLVYLIT